jgi:hypothetical protein
LISESALGRAVPWTRQNGTVTATPPTVAGGVTRSAAVIVASSDVTLRSWLQSTAASEAARAALAVPAAFADESAELVEDPPPPQPASAAAPTIEAHSAAIDEGWRDEVIDMKLSCSGLACTISMEQPHDLRKAVRS